MDVVFNVDGLQVLQFAIAVLLPLLVGLVTKHTTSSGTKAVLLLALSAVSAILTGWAAAAEANVAFDLGTAALTALDRPALERLAGRPSVVPVADGRESP